MPIKINVPKDREEAAKAAGALWDDREESWFVPTGLNIDGFAEWIKVNDFSIVVSSPFFIAHNKTKCWKCKSPTRVIALASVKFLQRKNEADDGDRWDQHSKCSLFSMPTFINLECLTIIENNFPFFKLGKSATAGQSYWGNYCEKCDALQGDFHLHNEPGGAFFPTEMSEYKTITLYELNTKFDLLLHAAVRTGTSVDNIMKYAKRASLLAF